MGTDDGSKSKHHTTAAGNPQANAIIKRIHQVPDICLRMFYLYEADLDEEIPWDEYLATTAFAIQSTVHTTLGASPAHFVCGRDIILPLQYKADWATITLKKQKKIDKSNHTGNSKRLSIQYKEGDLVLLTKPGILPKLTLPRAGQTL